MYEHDGDGLIPAKWPCIGKKRIIEKGNEKMVRKDHQRKSITAHNNKKHDCDLFRHRSATTEMMVVCTFRPEKKKRRTIPT